MKKGFKIMGLAMMYAMGVGVISSCGGSVEKQHHDDTVEHHEHHEEETHHEEASYACPMHPEVSGKEGEKCSECGMPLELVIEHEEGHDHSAH